MLSTYLLILLAMSYLTTVIYGYEKSFEIDSSQEHLFVRGTIGCIDRPMYEYLDSIFNSDSFASSNRQTAIVDYIVSLSQEVKTISDSLRNPAAHTSPMKCGRAEVCGNYIIKVQRLLFEFLAKLKQEK